MSDERTASAIDKRIGQRVRTRRLELSMSQEKLAELLGVTFQQVQKYEKGVNRIACSRMVDIAAALQLPIERFFEGLKSPIGAVHSDATAASDEIFAASMATPEAIDLQNAFAKLRNPIVRRRCVALVKSLSEDEPIERAAKAAGLEARQ